MLARPSLTDWLLAAFNGLLLVIIGGQLGVMRKDRRAWVSPQFITSQFVPDKPIIVNMAFPNTGRTGARHLDGKMRIEILDAAQGPTFDYSNPS
jgi:hypothetical protein